MTEVKFNQTRDGRKIRILCTDLDYSHPIVAAVTNPSGKETAVCYSQDGYFISERDPHSLDLVYVEPKVEKFQNLYAKGLLLSENYPQLSQRHSSLEFAKRRRSSSQTCLGVLKTTYQGDEIVDVEFIPDGSVN